MQEYHMQSNLPAVEAPAEDRIPLHTREVKFQGFARRDGLWDVEGTLRDTKEVRLDRFSMPPLLPGDTVHSMRVRVTLDDALKVMAIAVRMDTAPFGECQAARDPLQRLVGRVIGPGWRKAVNDAMGGVAGCTHLRELLVQLATAAFQAIPNYRDQLARERGEAPEIRPMPFFVGGCMSWRRDGPVVARLLPRYATRISEDTP